jgi:phospholipid/cholesterol/gamma-HCH transport system substrate-binding protein
MYAPRLQAEREKGFEREDMPSQQEVRWSQLKVGVIVLVAVVVLTTLLFLMTSSSGLGVFSHKLTLHTYFENAAGLKVGAAVNLQGVTIGAVKSVTVVSDPAHKLSPVEVFLKIDGRYQPLLRTDSRAGLSTQGVLGDTLVDINTQYATGPPLQDGAELQTLETPSLTDVVKAGKSTIESVNQILAKVNSLVDGLQKGNGSAGKLLSDPKLYNDADATVAELRTLTTNLNQGRGTVGKLMTDDSLYRRLDATVERFQNIADSLDAGKGTAGKLLKDETLYNNLNATLAHANSIMADADAGKGALGLMLKDPKFRGQLSDTLTQADALLAGVNNGKGTLGKLATDDQAYGNLNHLLTTSTELVTAIRENPKKYLTIHMKIF